MPPDRDYDYGPRSAPRPLCAAAASVNSWARQFAAPTTHCNSLHYSCQSLLVEAGAIDGLGVVTAFALPASKTHGVGGMFLSSVTWTLPTLLSVVNSTVPQFSSSRGYIITSGPYVVTQRSLREAQGGGLEIIPNTAAVAVKISFPLNTFYSTTLLSEKQTVSALLSSLIGLAGIFSLFGSLLAVTDLSAACLRKNACCARFVPGKRPRPFTSSPPSVVERAVEDDAHWSSNPLSTTRNLSGKEIPQASTHMENPADVFWYEITEDNDTWYVSSTGEMSWTLPEGTHDHKGVAPPRDSTLVQEDGSADILWFEVTEDDESWFVSSTGEASWVLPEGARLSHDRPPE